MYGIDVTVCIFRLLWFFKFARATPKRASMGTRQTHTDVFLKRETWNVTGSIATSDHRPCVLLTLGDFTVKDGC